MLINKLFRDRKIYNQEIEQTILRFSIVVALFIYGYGVKGDDPVYISNLITLLLVYIPVVLVIGIWVFYKPVINKYRRILTCFIDPMTLTVFIYILDDYGVVLLPLYIWFIIGNGLRFGTYYMKVSAFFNISIFIVKMFYTDLTQLYAHIYYGILIGMITVTITISALLKRLEKSVEKEKNASKAKNQFLANMSHDFRTPLSGILGSNGLLRKTKLTFEQKSLTDNINYSASILQDLIDNVLDLTSIEGGREPTKIEKINTNVKLSHLFDNSS